MDLKKVFRLKKSASNYFAKADALLRDIENELWELFAFEFTVTIVDGDGIGIANTDTGNLCMETRWEELLGGRSMSNPISEAEFEKFIVTFTD